LNLSDKDFEFLAGLSEKWMGSVFSTDKKYLFENRLLSMVRRFEYADIEDLIADFRSKGDAVPSERKEYFIDLITTHETLFFRDKSPFKCIKEIILPDFMERKPSPLDIKIYSAACSTGQEPVSLAIQMKESLPLGKRASIFATDISRAVIDYAKAGAYTQYEVQRGLPTRLLTKYFKQDGEIWQMDQELLSTIRYQVENLLLPGLKPFRFDLVLCRNVTIYMDKPKVRALYEKIHSGMNPGGYLLIGHSERMTDHTDLFEGIRSEAGMVYKRK
jgi:chemotaxis protein methyltransferase CheR